MHWLRISLLLCAIGFLKEFKTSEPFFVDYMQQPYRDVTTEELHRYILATNIYVNGFLSVVILFVTDYLRYKPIIILIGLSGMLTWGTLLWTKSFLCTQLAEIFYSIYVTSEVAYFAYIYAKVPKEHYLTATSYARAALMTGKFLASTMGQLLLFGNIFNLVELNYIDFCALMAAMITAMCLPKVQGSIYFYRQTVVDCVEVDECLEINHVPGTDKDVYTIENTEPCIIPSNHANTVDKLEQGFMVMWKQFKCAYSNRQVLLWSIWYACGLCGYIQILTFVQLLWNEIDSRQEVIWNGAVDAISTLMSAIIALLASRLHENVINTKVKVLWSLFGMSLCSGVSIFLMANTSQRFVSYAGYMLFYMFYIFTITIASAEIAKHIPEDSYGLIFGINTFIAYWIQIIFSLTLATDIFSLNLSIFNQFNIYGAFFSVLGFVYFVLILINGCPVFHRRKEINRIEIRNEN